MAQDYSYCDFNAGAPLMAHARDAMTAALAAGGNASSVHARGRRARKVIEDARETIAVCVGAHSENVIFTSGATEALHLCMQSAGARSLIMSAVEHDAVYEHGAKLFADAQIVGVDHNGRVDLAALDEILAHAQKPALVAIQLANNETGILQPIARIAAIVREHGGLLLVDAAQGVGRMDVSLPDLDASYLVLSSHKVGGPAGAGALVLAPGAPFVSQRFGGGQERGRRPGTENAPAIAGFGAAVRAAQDGLVQERARLTQLRDAFERGLPNGSIVFGADGERLCNTSNFAAPGVSAETAVIAMDLAGVGVSSGAACSSGKVRQSRVLSAMGVPSDVARRALRVSFGWCSQDADVARALYAIREIVERASARGGRV